MIAFSEISYVSSLTIMTLVKDEDIVRAISNGGITRVRQFGLYPLWTIGNLRGSIRSTRGPEWTHRWCTSCRTNGIAG